MSWNPYKRLLALAPGAPVNVGRVLALRDDGVELELADGSRATARGTASVDQWVYVRGGMIEGPAPDLLGTVIEV